MNITEALGDITAQFPRLDRPTDEAPAAIFEITSGGIREKARDPEPVLCLTSDLAIRAWRDHVLALLKADKAAGFTVLDGPHLDKWRITVADAGYTHRIAEERYSVTARIGIMHEALPVGMSGYLNKDDMTKETAVPDLPKPKPAKAAKKKVATA